ncbi:MAG TPA: ABC transporter permease [Streptosporangiaceae bacterium]|nr:ABC transporter permease [Streptosporangiaceae bacterium]
MWRTLRTGLVLQLHLIREHRDYALDLFRTPLLTVVFLLLVRHSGRLGLTVNAVVAAALTGIWGMGLLVSGEIVDRDRTLGVLELLVAAPVSMAALLIGRVLGTVSASALVIAEVWLVSVGVFQLSVPVHHAAVFAATVLATALAMSGTSLLMAALFVATRTARTFQNSLSYPFLLLGGVFVPADQLPGWLHAPARLIFLSWSADLLRDSLRSPPVTSVPPRLGAVALLGFAGFTGGLLLLRRVLRRARGEGTLGLV